VTSLESCALPLPGPTGNPVLAVATRSGAIESWHRGAVAVCHAGEPVLALGEVSRPVFARSAVKPLQALPFFERGLADRLHLSAEEIAVMCASHDGAPMHTAAVQSLLQKGGFAPEQLGCGPHAPFDPETRRLMRQSGERPTRLHNNCSGKHSGFLHLAHDCGDELSAYLDPASHGQQLVNAAVSAMAGAAEPLPTGLDGCGAPTFVLPLQALALAFCRLANPDGLPCVRADACRRIFSAVGQAPAMLAGERRFCTALLRSWPGQVLAKNGAEGVYAVALAPDPKRREFQGAIGIACKIDDGAERGYQPVIVDLLSRLGAFLDGGMSAAVAGFHQLPIMNTQQKQVGVVQSVASWSFA
jgi:L-asparaginase II